MRRKREEKKNVVALVDRPYKGIDGPDEKIDDVEKEWTWKER